MGSASGLTIPLFRLDAARPDRDPDVDSVAIAAAGLRRQGLVGLDTAGGAVLLATLANLVLKGGAVVVVGGRTLTRHVAPAFAALAVVTAILLALARLGA